MNKNLKALVVVEGEKTEKVFFDSMNLSLGLSFQVCPFKANVYDLWHKMKESDFTLNIKEVLLEKHPEEREILETEYAFYYLVFDMDPQHRSSNEDNDYERLAYKNITTLTEIAEYCVDETDPTVGKVYINYPMFESFRCCNSFDDESYKYEYAKVSEVKYFKSYCSSKRLAGVQVVNYKANDFYSLAKMNAYKMGTLYDAAWEYYSYDDYILRSNQKSIIKKQENLVNTKHIIAVLNTSVFLILDYYGNENGFYDRLMRG